MGGNRKSSRHRIDGKKNIRRLYYQKHSKKRCGKMLAVNFCKKVVPVEMVNHGDELDEEMLDKVSGGFGVGFAMAAMLLYTLYVINTRNQAKRRH